MNLLSSASDILIILFGFGALIFVHELGHFLAAKWAGIRAEAFAVGMGHAAVSWRRGIGLTLGSTVRKVMARTGRRPEELSDQELRRAGIGETEYSLRWLPIGGFVKMLGQDDLRPGSLSDDPRSYGRCPIGKRMVVVSAGVIMNLILAAVLFVVAFGFGVPFEDAVIGGVNPAMPAGRAVAEGAAAAGISSVGLQPGDRVLAIDGDPARRFADIQIASAMGRKGRPIEFEVQREGVASPLRFALVPEIDSSTGLLGIGVAPALSTTLRDDNPEAVQQALAEAGLERAGLEPGMRLVEADGRPVETLEQLQAIVTAAGGRPLRTRWSVPGAAQTREVQVPLEPVFQVLVHAEDLPAEVSNFEQGLLGLVPLVRIARVASGDNVELLRQGDVILRAGAADAPRTADLMLELQRHKRRTIDLQILRDGKTIQVQAHVNRKGRLNVNIEPAFDVPLVARPMTQERGPGGKPVATAAAGLDIFGGSRLERVGATPVADWAELRTALRAQTESAAAAGLGATVELTLLNPTPGAEQRTLSLGLTPQAVATLHALQWSTRLPSTIFEPRQVVLSAAGNPLRALTMGLEETHKTVLLTYLTIDRLFRGSVGVEQLRGPVGIVDLGARTVSSGLMFLLFFLAVISVNLAVLNFLPLPIVDGGLFLFLIYEKLKGRPPSVAFQNVATIVGIVIIGGLLAFVTWHDVVRLLSS
jgi:regulator of sigma E protease